MERREEKEKGFRAFLDEMKAKERKGPVPLGRFVKATTTDGQTMWFEDRRTKEK